MVLCELSSLPSGDRWWSTLLLGQGQEAWWRKLLVQLGCSLPSSGERKYIGVLEARPQGTVRGELVFRRWGAGLPGQNPASVQYPSCAGGGLSHP